jgi:hypothetical protein
MNIEQILRNPILRVGKKANNEEIARYFSEKIASYVVSNDEQSANSWSILNTIFTTQNEYLEIFELFADSDYYKAWCQLERIEIAIKNILRHFSFVQDEYKILFIKEYVGKLQSLFPYKVFGSSEIVKKEIRCSICDSIISLRNRCIHKKGELYMGEFCTHIITQSELIGLSAVYSPFNKYSVLGVTGKENDNFNYQLIDFLMDIIDHPFNQWSTEHYRILEDHSKYSTKRNEKCPCGSQQKYKKCCLVKAGVELEHTDFKLKYPTMKSKGMRPTDKTRLLTIS